MAMNTKRVGDMGEQLAAEYLERAGYKILERNVSYADCEVDIICECVIDDFGNILPSARNNFFNKFGSGKRPQGNRLLVFCEVKTRYGTEYGTGAEAVTPYKMGRYVTAAKLYCLKHRCSGCQVRFDVIDIGDDGLNHIENAFTESDAKYRRR